MCFPDVKSNQTKNSPHHFFFFYQLFSILSTLYCISSPLQSNYLLHFQGFPHGRALSVGLSFSVMNEPVHKSPQEIPVQPAAKRRCVSLGIRFELGPFTCLLACLFVCLFSFALYYQTNCRICDANDRCPTEHQYSRVSRQRPS